MTRTRRLAITVVGFALGGLLGAMGFGLLFAVLFNVMWYGA